MNNPMDNYACAGNCPIVEDAYKKGHMDGSLTVRSEIATHVIEEMETIIREMQETAQAMMWAESESACECFMKQTEKLKEKYKK